ncbi:MAG: hypothetical protein E3J66_01565 [Dehalococcoidia bacterium]|nr:MAG: hypothetical protein E3J66_01565 [Dehalococcoidia bacterium]
MKFITHSDLVKQAKRWLEKAHGTKFACGVVLAEFVCTLPEIPDVIGFSAHRSIVIECKVSRADFLGDKKKSCRHRSKQLGNLRYYLVLPHVACAGDIDNGWGLLYATDKEIREVKESEYFGADSVKAAEWSILYSVVRRTKLRGLLADIQKPLAEDDMEL